MRFFFRVYLFWGLLVSIIVLLHENFVLSDHFLDRSSRTGTDDSKYLSLHLIPAAVINVKTSSADLAGTTDAIFATFTGDFSLSGPHLLGSFNQSSTVSLSVQLDRVIGRLQGIVLTTDGFDDWLLSSLTCQYDNVEYVFGETSQWLVAFNPSLYNTQGVGFSGDGEVARMETLYLTTIGSIAA